MSEMEPHRSRLRELLFLALLMVGGMAAIVGLIMLLLSLGYFVG